MSTLTTINSGDLITNSRTTINNNFSALNTDKMETSVLDTDTALTANSDSKIPSQKAVKAYVDAGGNVNASTTVKGISEEADQTETDAGTAVGATGARLFVNPSTLAGYLSNAGYMSKVANGATSYDLTTASGTVNIAHGLAVSPRQVKLVAYFSDSAAGSSAANIANAYTVYNGTTQASTSNHIQSSSSASGNRSVHSQTFRIGSEYNKYQEAVITVTSTNIVLTWTKTSTPTGTAYLTWEAIA